MSLLLLLLASFVLPSKGDGCVARCERLHVRSIQRIGFDGEKVARLLEKQRPTGALKDICWRLFDKLDCLKRCPKDKETEKFGRDVRFKCKGVLGDLAGDLKCVSRYRSFIQIKCSTFLKEAVSSRVTQAAEAVPDRETCRYLHLNSLCLENTVGNYCPSATAIFRRLNFRDYFLNFIIPEDDQLFDDVDLDSCQIYDFVRPIHKASSSQEEDDELTTIVNRWEEEEEMRQTEAMTTTTTTESTATTRKRERQEFTTLLNDLLSSESTEITIPLEETTTETTLLRVTATGQAEVASESVPVTMVDRTPETVETTSGATVDRELEGTSPSYTKKTIFQETSTTAERTTTVSPSPRSSSSVKTNRVTLDKSFEEDLNTSTIIVIPSNRRKVFSDDSMENTPPNFFYSSARYRTSTLSANHGSYHSSTERDREIVRPVEVDTSTLLGDDFPSGPVETEPAHWTTTSAPEVIILAPEVITVKYTPKAVTPKKTTRVSVTFSPKAKPPRRNKGYTTPKPGELPLLNGGVVVKSIKRWGEPESDEEMREVEKIQRSPVVDEEELDKIMVGEGRGGERRRVQGRSSEQFEYEEVTTRDASSNGRLSENEILIFIILVLFALALVSLICVLLFCICCRRKASPHSNKY